MRNRSNYTGLFIVLALIGIAILGRQLIADIGANYRYERVLDPLVVVS